MLIKELSKLSKTTIHMIRFFEKNNLISSVQNPNNFEKKFNEYDVIMVKRLEIINAAREVALSMKETILLIDSYFNKEMSITEKLQLIDKTIERLEPDFLKNVLDKLAELKSIFEKSA